MSVSTRLTKVEDVIGRADGEPCNGGITCIVSYCPELGDAEPEIPPDAADCRRCGKPHALILVHQIVTSGKSNHEHRQSIE